MKLEKAVKAAHKNIHKDAKIGWVFVDCTAIHNYVFVADVVREVAKSYSMPIVGIGSLEREDLGDMIYLSFQARNHGITEGELISLAAGDTIDCRVIKDNEASMAIRVSSAFKAEDDVKNMMISLLRSKGILAPPSDSSSDEGFGDDFFDDL